MADKFRVGTKIRIVKSKNYPQLIGTEHVIVGPMRDCSGKNGKKWRGYDIGLLVGRVRICPQESNIQRVYTPPAPGLQRIGALEKELRA